VDVFDDPSLGSFYKTVNNLKISTDESVIERELLIKEGDKFDPFLVEESERNLRSLPYLRRVSITPVHDGGFVDLIVSVQDTWTLIPQLNLALGGGRDKKSIGIAESNLLGYGKRAELLYADEDGREQVQGVWDDRRFMGTHQRLLLAHFERTDGYRFVGLWGKPFRSLVEPYAWSFNTDLSDQVSKLFEASEERYIFRQRHTQVGGGYTFSHGDPTVILQRYTLGYEFSSDKFQDADDKDFRDVDVDPDSVSRDPALLPEDRRFSGPYIAFEQIEPDFISINYVDRFERVEDFNLGQQINARFGFASEVFDSSKDALLVSYSVGDGTRIDSTSFVRAEAGLSSRVVNGGLENSLIRGEVKYYNVLGAQELFGNYVGKHTLAGQLSMDLGERLDKDREFLLGADDGLRGYKINTFTGDYRLIGNVEDRMHFVEDIYQLFSLGAAVFADFGGTSQKGYGDLIKNNFFADVGMGLRIGLPRSSSGTVVRIDVAVPLRDGPDGSDRGAPRFLFTVSQLFRAQLRSETLGPERANLSVGLTP